MTQKFTIKIGELRLGHHELSNKAGLLDKIALRDLGQKGLMPAKFAPIQMAVPESAVILDEFFHHAVKSSLIDLADNEVTVPDAAAFMNEIEIPAMSGKIAVRSAFTGEDGSERSLAGHFESVLNVPIESVGVSPARLRDPKPLADAIAKVWTSGLKAGVKGRLDILIMRMVEAKHAGVAFTEKDYEDDIVSYTEGLADQMLAGNVAGHNLELPKLSGMDGPSTSYTNLPFASRLQVTLRSIRMGLGKGNWDIEWADDGETLWILQARPITAETVRNEIFAFGPVKEALPEMPSRFMSSLITACGDDIYGWYRQFDPTLPIGRKYYEMFAGRPMLNLSLMMDTMRHWGLPTSTVTSLVGGAPGNEAAVNRRRQMKSRGPRFAMKLASVRAASESRDMARDIQAMGEHPGDSIADVIETAKRAYTRLARQMLALRNAIGSHQGVAGARSLGSQMYTDLAPMRAIAAANPAVAAALAKGEVPRDTAFRLKWEGWLKKHGHRAMYETDLARPRFRENQSEVLRMIGLPSAIAPSVKRSPLAPMLSRSPAAKATAAREELRFDAMVAFERIRRRLLDLATPKGVDSETFFSLTIDEAKQLDHGWRPTAEFAAERRAEIEAMSKLRIPDVIRRNDPLETGASRSLHGIGLCRGEANGRAWVLREPSTRLPEGFTPGNTILVTPSVDAGWVPTFGLVSGVVIESGSMLSHGSIILRELGIPAVTAVKGATHDIQQGERIRVAAGQGRVDVLQ